MKREHPDDEKQAAQNRSDTISIFSNFNHHKNDDGDQLTLLLPSSQDGASIEVSRRPRGRPPGSKNKPKPPTILTTTTTSSGEPAMSPYVLELPPGVDIIESTTRFCRKRGIGLCILNGNGVVSNVTLKQPSTTTPASTVTFHGRFDVLSITGTILSGGSGGNGSDNFSISLAGPQGQVVGGLVVGPLVAVATIYLIAASFNDPSFHVLRSNDDLDRDGVGIGDEPTSGGGDISNYSYPQPQPDVIWAPTARPPHHLQGQPPY